MTTWLLPPRSGATIANSAGTVYTGTLGVPVPFLDADVTIALAQGWTYSDEAPVEQLGKLIGIPATLALDSDGDVEGIIDPKTGKIAFLNKLVLTAIPVIIPPSGAGSSISASGVVTLVAALNTTYSACWMFFPAGAVVGDATGGLYYVQMTSTTQGNVYTNGKTGGATGATNEFVPYIPTGTLVLAVGSGATFTHTLATDFSLIYKTVSGGSLGNNGSIRTTQHWQWSSAVSSKTIKTKLGGVSLFDADNGGATNNGYYLQNMTTNRGAPNLQINNPGFQVFSRTTTGFGQRYTTINTANDQAFELTGRIATATDWIVLEQCLGEVFPQS